MASKYYSIEVTFPRSYTTYTYVVPREISLKQGDHVIVPAAGYWQIARVSSIHPTLILPNIPGITWKRILGQLNGLPPINSLSMEDGELIR